MGGGFVRSFVTTTTTSIGLNARKKPTGYHFGMGLPIIHPRSVAAGRAMSVLDSGLGRTVFGALRRARSISVEFRIESGYWMRCPFCHHDNDKVLDSRAAEAGYMHRRKRLCQDCQRRFTTIEQIEELNVRVVKNDETREPFDREKIRRGIERACSKQSIESDRIEDVVQAIETDIYAEFDFEIPASVIGEIVLRHLADLDEVAYIRFASVYREFGGADDFLRIIGHLSQRSKANAG